MKTKVVDPSLLATTMGRPVVLPGKSNETEPIQTVTVGRPVSETVPVGTLAVTSVISGTVEEVAVTSGHGEVASDMPFSALETLDKAHVVSNVLPASAVVDVPGNLHLSEFNYAVESFRHPSEIVHRMWARLNSQGSLSSEDSIVLLPGFIEQESLISWSHGYRQIVWCWQQAPVFEDEIQWCESRNAEVFLPLQVVQKMLAGGVHIAQVKDVLQMHVLAVCGVFSSSWMSFGWADRCLDL